VNARRGKICSPASPSHVSDLNTGNIDTGKEAPSALLRCNQQYTAGFPDGNSIRSGDMLFSAIKPYDNGASQHRGYKCPFENGSVKGWRGIFRAGRGGIAASMWFIEAEFRAVIARKRPARPTRSSRRRGGRYRASGGGGCAMMRAGQQRQGVLFCKKEPKNSCYQRTRHFKGTAQIIKSFLLPRRVAFFPKKQCFLLKHQQGDGHAGQRRDLVSDRKLSQT
jgi:hypothetical protein